MKRTLAIALIATSAMATVLRADTLELKNGTIASGTYQGGTATTVRFETAQGVQVYPKTDILALTFTGDAAAAAPAASAVPAANVAPITPPPAAAPASFEIPAGTPLVVRMMDGISSKNKAGTRFTTTLDSDLVINGSVALKAGTKIYGELMSSKQAGRAVGKSQIDIRLTEIALPGAPSTLIATSSFQEAGKGSGRKTAGAAAVGAGIGAVADGGEGAAKGAAIGAGVSLLKKGETVTVPPNMLLEFTLTRPVTINPAS